MGIKQSRAFSLSKIYSARFSGFMELYMSYMLIYSTPEPTPISMCPALILLATRATASNPLEQKRLTVTKVVVSGMPAKNPAILEVMAPAPGWLTLPTTMSSMSLGSILVLSMRPFKA